MKKSRKSRKKSRRAVALLFVGLGVLVLVLIGLLSFSFGFFEKSEAQMLVVSDECGVMPGFGLIHQVRDEGECRVKCVNECGLMELDFLNISFVASDSECHYCECWCE